MKIVEYNDDIGQLHMKWDNKSFDQERKRLFQENMQYLNMGRAYIRSREGEYHFINDTYFDYSILLQTYIDFIASYGILKITIKWKKGNILNCI